MSRTQTISSIDYNGIYTAKIDEKNRLKIPARIREIMMLRNEHNFQSPEFAIQKSRDVYIVTYQGNPFAVIESDRPVTKTNVGMETIDELVYVAVGTIKRGAGAEPNFMHSEPDTVFLYNATDAQHMIYDPEFKKLGFAARHHVGSMDAQGRLQLAHIIENFEKVLRHITNRDRNTHVIGHPSIFCATLTKYD